MVRRHDNAWLLPLLFVAVLGLLAVLALLTALSPWHKTAFTIRAQTGVLMVEPDCGQSLTWDLPRGEVRTLGANAQAESERKLGPVSIVVRAGAQAVLERRDAGEWRVVVKPLDAAPDCAGPSPSTVPVGVRNAEPVTLSAAARISVLRLEYTNAKGQVVENEPVEASPDGYAYRSVTAGAAEPDKAPVEPGLSPLRLAGRVLLGSPVTEGGGWSGGSLGILRSASIEGRVRHGFGDQLSVLLREQIDPGSLIDTHACLDPTQTDQARGDCEMPGANAAVGFATAASVDDISVIDVVVYRHTTHVGVLPYAGEQRVLRVTWWTRLLNEPLAQQATAALVLLTTLLTQYGELKKLLARLPVRSWFGRRRRPASAAPPHDSSSNSGDKA